MDLALVALCLLWCGRTLIVDRLQAELERESVPAATAEPGLETGPEAGTEDSPEPAELRPIES